MLNYFNSNYFMNNPTLVEATIRAKVIAKHLIQKDYKRNYELIVMIQKMSYIIVDKKTSETKTGSIEAENFIHKAKFWFHLHLAETCLASQLKKQHSQPKLKTVLEMNII